MGVIKKIFGSGEEEDGADLKHRNSRTSLDNSAKASDAKKKNDELAASLGHSKSTSSDTSSARNLTSGTTGYNTEGTSATQGNDATAKAANAAQAARTGGAGAAVKELSSSDGKPVDSNSGIGGSHTGNLHGAHVGASNDDSLNRSANLSGNDTINSGLNSNNNTSSSHSNTAATGAAVAGVGAAATGAAATDGLVGRSTGDSNISGNRSSVGSSSELGRVSKSTSGRGFDNPHEIGHRASRDLQEFDPKVATHDHQHLQHVTHREVRHVEVEEVERQREVDRHVHHVQTHVQPVIDKQVLPEQIHENIVPVTKIAEKHASTAEDVSLFTNLATQHKDSEVHRPKERTVVDLGERVTEKIHHHVHHVTQPIIEQEVVERHRIHTVIPVHHVTHEAPIIHKSSVHAPVSMTDFLQGGGKLDSKITHETANLLPTNECEREVDGVAEKLVSELGLGSSTSHYGTTGSHVGSTGHSSTGSTGLTSGSTTSKTGDYVSKDGDHHSTKVGQVVDNITPSNNRIGDTQKI